MRDFEYTFPQTKKFASFLADRFINKPSASIRLDLLNGLHTNNGFVAINDEEAKKVARLFKSRINEQILGSKFRRFKHEMVVVVSLHKTPQWHFHIQAEIPAGRSISDIEQFAIQFAKNTAWLETDRPYVEFTNSNYGSQLYNSRFDADNIIDF